SSSSDRSLEASTVRPVRLPGRRRAHPSPALLCPETSGAARSRRSAGFQRLARGGRRKKGNPPPWGKRGTKRQRRIPRGPVAPVHPAPTCRVWPSRSFRRPAPRAVALLLAIVLTAVLAPGGAGAARRFTLETEHFLVHFDGGYEALAHEVARIAEEVHRELAPRVGHVPSEKTHLVLADTTDLATARPTPSSTPRSPSSLRRPRSSAPMGRGSAPACASGSAWSSSTSTPTCSTWT